MRGRNIPHGAKSLVRFLTLVVIVVGLSSLARAQDMHSDGTLIILVASRDRLVVASDSRQTIDEKIYCDGANKILEPVRPGRFIVAVTGRRGFYPLTIASAHDVCDYIRRTAREFDLGEAATDFIERQANVKLSDLDIKKLADHCIQSLVKYLTANPHRLPAASFDFFSSSIVLASYDPTIPLVVIRSVEISVSSEGSRLIAKMGLDERFTSDDLAEPIAAGERDYLVKHVLPNLRSHSISNATRTQLGSYPTVHFQKVGDTSLEDAVAIATDLIEAASKMTMSVPASSGIGGPIDVRLLGNAARPQRLR